MKMCKCGDLSCDCFDERPAKVGKPTRFEVGKKYTYLNNTEVFECAYSGETHGVVFGDSYCLPQKHKTIGPGGWKEYTESPKVYFKDLKPGDKFRWAHSKGIGPVLRKARVSGTDGFYCEELHTATAVEGQSKEVLPVK